MQLEGNSRWLEMLKPDSLLIESFDGSMEALQNQAQQILDNIETTSTQEGIANYLFQKYEKTEDCQMRDAIVYLIKNGCSVPKNRLETKEKYQKIKRKLEIKIQRLKRQIEMSIPSGRDLEGEKWLHTLILASNTMPVDQSESDSWFSALKRNSPSIPYPIVYETNEDLKWCLNDQNRICIKFSGLSDHIFQIYCDSRQLPYFWRFYEDQELKKASKDQFSSALFTLRSAMIIWKEDDGKGEPWHKNKLYLLYQGNPNFFLGVAMGLQEPVTIALVDVTTNKVILYRNIKQLLGDNYHLIRRRRNEKQKLNRQNHKARKRANFQQKGESNLGEYLDRLIAKSILQIAKEYQVSTIIIPRLKEMRSITEAEIQARAEERIPEYKEGQRKYAQDYRVQVHQWSYGRLINNIKAISSKLGIVVEEGKQPKQGKFTDKALQLALSTQKNNRQNNPTKTNS